MIIMIMIITLIMIIIITIITIITIIRLIIIIIIIITIIYSAGRHETRNSTGARAAAAPRLIIYLIMIVDYSMVVYTRI